MVHKANKVLIISPHPDDETLGCGGTILKHKAEGAAVYWLIISNISVKEGYDEGIVNKRQLEIAKVASEYDFDNTYKLDFPTTKLDTLPIGRLVSNVSSVIQEVQPDTVYVPNRNDIHSDHRITFDVAVSSMKAFRCPFIKKILMYEVLSETEAAPPLFHSAFIPNSFSDISAYLEKKLSIMKVYESEISEHPFPRSLDGIKALAHYRGGAVYVKYAEAFYGLREIW